MSIYNYIHHYIVYIAKNLKITYDFVSFATVVSYSRDYFQKCKWPRVYKLFSYILEDVKRINLRFLLSHRHAFFEDVAAA
jgi:hypothetical protein